ncbi:WecB/TagA/CpsF family glycosyltransferase [Jeotgalibacillus marinus]|uniref:N-acetylglucosaminyldiphosphoundecaprenol N-acetyl-beta-D-mannosaminyltransferase n=1 Tax=Jeotgalibacillus marinus TaxID=86667 RepID=A0ABV3Q4L4_9BACL
MTLKFIPILEIPFIKTTRKQFVEMLQSHIDKQEKSFVVTANPEIVMHAHQSDEYKKCLHKANYITADGIGIVKAAKIIGNPLPERVCGYDIMIDLFHVSNKKNYSIYLLGASQRVLQDTVEVVKKKYPGINVAGHQNGFFDWKDPSVVQNIKKTQPDLVFVALGFPRQEQWISNHLDHFDKGIFIGVGGSFDVFSGNVNRAPEIWRKLNVEWFYRLVKQPSRWRRMLVLPKFAMVILSRKVLKKS